MKTSGVVLVLGMASGALWAAEPPVVVVALAPVEAKAEVPAEGAAYLDANLSVEMDRLPGYRGLTKAQQSAMAEEEAARQLNEMEGGLKPMAAPTERISGFLERVGNGRFRATLMRTNGKGEVARAVVTFNDFKAATMENVTAQMMSQLYPGVYKAPPAAPPAPAPARK